MPTLSYAEPLPPGARAELLDALCGFGPFEWLWRSFTYGHSQPMRRANAFA